MNFLVLLLLLYGGSCISVTSHRDKRARKYTWRADEGNETAIAIEGPVIAEPPKLVVEMPEEEPPAFVVNKNKTNSPVVAGRHLPGLRIKWGIGVPGFDCLYDIPRTVSDALGQTWRFVPRPENAVFPAMGMFCPPKDYTFCVLFDPIHGFVAGIQVAIPSKVLRSLTDTYLEDVGFIKWINSEGEFWTTSQYYVSSEGPKAPESEEILRENAIWIPDFLGTLMKINIDEKDAPTSGFVKQGCRMAVGRHYFYNMTTSMKCTDILPWYLLYDNGVLVGSGFIVFGTMPKQMAERDWFETTDLQIMKQTVPHGPKCIMDSIHDPGIITTKIYFVDQPYQSGWSSYCFE